MVCCVGVEVCRSRSVEAEEKSGAAIDRAGTKDAGCRQSTEGGRCLGNGVPIRLGAAREDPLDAGVSH